LYCDRDRLKTVLCNLLANAFSYHNLDQDNPAIYLTAEIQNRIVQISVTDNGAGIHEAHLDKLFNMFFRGSETSVGAGLGLYIAKEMVTKLEGSISVVSKLNQGSTFCVNIPIGT
jgi:signal transduction histidine kinase